MAVTKAYKILWSTGLVFAILSHLNLGLLSDYKICGDSECQSLMSRVQAIRDHHGKDCRFLNFKRRDIIFVYHKLTGKRDDLWAGSIDKQFGYFPKDAVQEEQVHATIEKVVETQESDFFCMDENGYFIDSSHLDDDADDDHEKIQNQESEITQTTPYTDDTKSESPSKPEDVSTERPVLSHEADGISTEEDENKIAHDAAAGTHEEAQETSVAANEQGGSASSAWLGSSVTGWLGLATEEVPAEGVREDERKETAEASSFTSSVTGWLGFGGEGKPDDAVKSTEEDHRQSEDSFTSTMTGWLGFGGEKKNDDSTEKEQDEERENEKEQEPAEKFRSRRMSLDLEGSQLHEEEKEEMGTLDWLGNGLSNTLGFGLTNQESEHERTTEGEAEETIQEEEEQPPSSSWFDTGVRDILGFRRDKSEDDEKTGSDLKGAEEDKTLEGLTGSENVDTSLSQPVLTEEVRTETSDELKMEETPKDQNVSAETETETLTGTTETVSEETDVNSLDSLGMIGKNTETETHQGEVGQEGEGHSVRDSSPEFGSSHNTDVVSENATEEDKITFSTESTAQMEDNPDQDHTQNDSDAHMLKETVKETEKDENNLKPFQTETIELEKYILNESGLRSSTGSETVSDEREEKQGGIDEEEVKALQEQQEIEEEKQELKEEEKQEKTEELEKEKKQEVEEETKEKENQGKEEELKEEEEVKALEKQQEMEEEKQDEADELKEEEKQEEIEELEKEEKQEEEEETKEKENQGEEEELKKEEEVKALEKQQEMEVEKQEKVEEFKEEEKQEEIEEFKEEEKQEVEEETKEEKNQGEEEELKEEEEVKALEKQQEVEEEKQNEAEELQEDEKQEERQKLEKEEKQEEEEETKEKENQGEEEELKGEEEVKALEKQQEVEVEKQDKEGELKEEEKQEEIEEFKKEEKQEVEEETKEEKNQGEEEERLEEVKGLKEDEEQQQIEELKEETQENVKELTEDQRGEDLKEVEEVNEKDKKVSEEKQPQLSHFEVETENTEGPESESNDKETQGGISSDSVLSETSTQTEKRETQNPQIEEETTEEENKKTEEVEEEKDELKEEEVEEKQEMEYEENEKRDQEEEGDLKCLNGLCHQASEDGFVGDKDGNDSANRLSSIDEGEETGKQNPMANNDQILAVRTGVSQTVPSESTERDEDRKQEEEQRNNDLDAGEGEKKTSESSLTRNEEVKSNNANSISDPDALGVNQIKNSDCKDNDQLCSGESGQNSLHDHVTLGQTAENKEGDQLYSSEAKNINLSDDNMLRQEDKTKPEYTETNGQKTEQIHSDQKIDTKEDTDREEGQMNGKHDDVNEDADMQMKINDGSTVGTEGGIEISVSSSDPEKSQVVTSEQDAQHVSQHASGSSLPSDGHSKGITKTEGGGAFGLLKNAFRFFSETPATESTESAPSLDSNAGETSEAQESLTPEQQLDLTADSTQVHIQDLHTDSPITLSQQQQQPSPSPSIQTSSPSPTQNLFPPSSQSPNTGSSHQTKTLSKHYKNLLTYMSVDEMTILIELFGRHKLQFLDYILGSSDSMTDDPDNDESILSDIERLLHYHKETLAAPSLRLADAAQEDKEKTRTLIALQNFELLLAKVRETFNTGKSDISNTIHQAKAYKDKEIATKEESSKVGHSSVGLNNNNPRDQWMGGHLNGGTGKEGVNKGKTRGEEEKRVSPESRLHVQAGPSQTLEGVLKQILDSVHQMAEYSTTHIHEAKELLVLLSVQVVSSLPDDIRPGPDLYGVPWEPVVISSVVGLMTMLLFTCRCYSSFKSRMYRSKERWMADQVAQLLDEKCKVLETLSKCQQEYDELEDSLRDSSVLAQTQKTEHLQGKARQLENAKRELERDIEQLNDQLDQQKEHRIEQERRIAVLEESMKTFEDEIKDLQSQDEQAQTTLKVYNMNSDRLQRNLETAREENTLLQESNTQLRQQVEGWAERVSDMEAEMSRCEVAHHGMLQDVANKDERIMSLTDRLLRMKAWDSDLEEEEGKEGGEKETSNGTAGRGEENGKGDQVDTQGHLQKVQKLIYAAKLNADLKSVDEDKDRAFAKLDDEVKAKEDLLESIKELENEQLSLQSDTEHYSDQVQRLQQKLNIMTEMYQENELKLHRLLTVEEKERLQKEEKLNKADKNIALALEELNNYRQRAQEMEEELDKTKQSYQTQMSAHEKKAHNNWLAARAADRELSDIRRENGLLRQKLTDTQFKLDALDKDPYALNSLARPLPFRAERSPYGPSPLGRPASETRAFLSPPTLMDGPPARLSPRVPRGPMEPPGGQGEMERSGGPHSDSGSNSPTWERDRRGPPPGPPGPLGPPGYMFPEPGGPMYRRPPPPQGPLGLLPPPGSIPPGPLHIRGLPPGPLPHPADVADVAYRENSFGPGEQEHRESGSGARRTPPETDPRIGGIPPPGPPMGPMDGPFPRRAPYGMPPPDFYPPRGPGGPPMMPMWTPAPPGMMFPPRFPPGGPPLPPVSHHAPPMRPPLPDSLPPPSMGPLPPQQSLPSPPHSQLPEEHRPSPEDAI